MAKEWAKAFYNSKSWKATRDSVLDTANYICSICKDRPAEIVHHIIWLTPTNINNVNITLSKSNLVAVCRECHSLIHEGTDCCTEGLKFNDRGELVKNEIKNLHDIQLYRHRSKG